MVKLVAEIGCNHKGDFNIAKNMIAVAASCGADVVKFQKEIIWSFLVLRNIINLIQYHQILMESHTDCIEII